MDLTCIPIVDHVFEHCLADALDHAAMNLSLEREFVDHRADIIDYRIALDRECSGIGVDLNFAHVAAVGEHRGMHLVILDHGQATLQIVRQVGQVYGFALEGFDAIGRARQKNRAGQPIDTRTTLVDGTEIQGFEGLRQYLLSQRRDSWVRQFCRKLLGYALGRGVQLSDELLLDRMMEQLAENDYRVSAAIEVVVLSEQFRKIRGVVD